jgi:tetratricopeptide (TPR) repeat protein
VSEANEAGWGPYGHRPWGGAQPRGIIRGRTFAIAAVLALALAPAPAAADKADELFKRGKAQLAKKQYAEACATFEKVDALDPGIGAKLNVAKCYQEWGRLVRAHKWYVDAEKMTTRTGDKRAPKIKALVEQIDPDVPRLTVRVSEGADLEAAAITLDGEPVAAGSVGREVRIEPGPHVITYRVDGEKKTKTIAIERGGARELTLELTGRGRATESTPGSEPRGDTKAAPPDPGRTRRIAGYALMGAGALSLGISTYLTLDARGTYQTALDTHCMGAKDMCNEEGLRITSDARGQANVATVFALVGVAAAAGGVVLYLTTPRPGKAESLSRNPEALYLAPVIGDGAGFVVLGGRY